MQGTAEYSNGAYQLTFFRRPPELRVAEFVVHGKPNGAFPTPIQVLLNGIDICTGEEVGVAPPVTQVKQFLSMDIITLNFFNLINLSR